MSEQCSVTAIYSYPVKSCRGTPVKTAKVSPTGIVGDRQLMILRDGKFINQARLPALATVATRRIDSGTITFDHETSQTVTHTIGSDGTESTVNFYGNDVVVIDQGDALATWMSDAVGEAVRVVGLRATFRRTVPLAEFAVVDGIDQSRFVDVAPILVTNDASLADINRKLESPIPMNRFRPNIVIDGLEAFGEDSITALESGDLRLVRATHCERCAVTCTDQESGALASEPLATLRGYRHRENGYAGGVMFGAYMGVEGTAMVSVGDVFTIA